MGISDDDIKPSVGSGGNNVNINPFHDDDDDAEPHWQPSTLAHAQISQCEGSPSERNNTATAASESKKNNNAWLKPFKKLKHVMTGGIVSERCSDAVTISPDVSEQVVALQSSHDDKDLQLDGLLKVKQFLVAKLRECEEVLCATTHERDVLEHEFRELGTHYSQLEEENSRLSKQLSDALEKEEMITAAASKSGATAEQRVLSLESRLASLQKELSAETKRADAAEDKLCELELEFAAARDLIEKAANRAAEAEESADVASRKAHDLEEEITLLKVASSGGRASSFGVKVPSNDTAAPHSPWRQGENKEEHFGAEELGGDADKVENNLLKREVSMLQDTILTTTREVMAFKHHLEAEHGLNLMSSPSVLSPPGAPTVNLRSPGRNSSKNPSTPNIRVGLELNEDENEMLHAPQLKLDAFLSSTPASRSTKE